MSIELVHDPVLSDTDILDCVAATPCDPNSRISYLVALGRALEQKVLRKSDPYRWRGEGPAPARWNAPDGTIVYRSYADMVAD